MYTRIFLILALLGLSTSAIADGRWYAGGSVGRTDFSKILENTGFSGDDSDTGFKLSGGYEFNRYFSVEAAYYNFGEVQSDVVTFPAVVTPGINVMTPDIVINLFGDTFTIPGFNFPVFNFPTVQTQIRGTAEVESASIAMVGRAPISDRWSFYGRGGISKWQVDANFQGTVNNRQFIFVEDVSGTDGFGGLGFEFDINDNMSISAEMERYFFENHDVDTRSVNFRYRFGSGSK